MTQEPEKLLSMELGKIAPYTERLLEIGGGTTLGALWNIGHHRPLAVKLGPAAGAQPM